MTRFSNFTDKELDAMETAFCEEGLRLLVDEVRIEKEHRHRIEPDLLGQYVRANKISNKYRNSINGNKR